MNFLWFANILVHHPFVILTGVAVFSCTCLVIPFTLKTFPDFSDPRQGFETRGTVLSNRITAWKNLEESTRPSGPFAVNPKEFLEKQHFAERFKKRNIIKNETTSTTEPYIIVYEDTRNESTRNEPSKWVKLHNLLISKPSINRPRIKMQNSNKDFFCGAPDEVYIRVVLESINGSDLFTLDSLLALCRLEIELIQAQHYKSLCVQTFTKPRRCCKPWSLANYIAQLHNRSSCLVILEEDIYNTKMLLRSCSSYFHNFELAPDCYENDHCKVPTRCVQYNAVFNILNFLTSVSFLPPNKTSDVILKQTMIFLPIAGSTATLPYYHVLEEAKLEDNGISVVGMDLGVKSFLFDEYLIRDTWLMSIGGLFILICIWLYTTSLFLTIMTIIAVTFSLGISYFMYTLVFELHFFPFMNLLATIVVIGIGADDVFIFCKAWRISKKEKDWTTVQLMNNTFQHAFTSMIITSVTTSAAFIASYISTITTVRCFSIFAATAVLVNCLLMMWWLPACMVILENWSSNCPKLSKKCSFLDISKWKIWDRFNSCKLKFLVNLWKNKEQMLVDGVIRFRYFWLVLLTTITILSGIVVLHYPKLQLPTTTEFQLFDKTHLFERYDSVYKNMFWFARTDKTSDPNMAANYKLPLRFVWGILPVDNGNYMNPQSLGEIVYDPNFDISRQDSQEWLLKFCRKLRKQPFYQSTAGPLLPNCFIETFVSLMQRRCIDPIDNIDRTPCCETSQFPYNSSIFNTCIVPVMSEMFDTPSEYFVPGVAGPKFSKDDFPTIKAIVVEYDSSYDYSMSYKNMHEFVYNVEAWTVQQLKDAPLSMQNGWFVSDFEFYDLQNVLSEGTLAAIIVSMSLSLVVLVLATLNVVTSFYAILTIFCSILAIVAVLVLLGWQLNVLESIAISTAIGLTVDFSLHYTVHYGFCLTSENRKASTRYALIIMTGPTSMAAVTTGAAGAFMMSSTILPYIRIGIFLLTVTSISWIYSTFFLCSLLAVAGPQNDFGQFQYAMLCCKKEPTSFKTRKARQNTSSSLSEVHELSICNSKSGLTSSSNRTLERSLSCGKNITTRPLNDQSSSAASAVTIFMEDN